MNNPFVAMTGVQREDKSSIGRRVTAVRQSMRASDHSLQWLRWPPSDESSLMGSHMSHSTVTQLIVIWFPTIGSLLSIVSQFNSLIFELSIGFEVNFGQNVEQQAIQRRLHFCQCIYNLDLSWIAFSIAIFILWFVWHIIDSAIYRSTTPMTRPSDSKGRYPCCQWPLINVIHDHNSSQKSQSDPKIQK